MKKNLLALLLVASMVLSACGTTDPAETTETNSTEAVSTETAGDLSELDALGDVEVEKNLFNVTITIPADYVGEEATQADLDEVCEAKGYKSITLNEDGSATYVMTKEQHKEMMEETRTLINDSLNEMIGSESYPNITAIEANDDYTEFVVTTKSVELDMAESFSVMGFYLYGGLYAIYNGVEVDNISVKFVNADTGNVISEANSSDLQQ